MCTFPFNSGITNWTSNNDPKRSHYKLCRRFFQLIKASVVATCLLSSLVLHLRRNWAHDSLRAGLSRTLPRALSFNLPKVSSNKDSNYRQNYSSNKDSNYCETAGCCRCSKNYKSATQGSPKTTSRHSRL